MVDHMLRFLYTSNYLDNAEGSRPLLVDAKVYAMADKYDISDLKHLAQEKFAAALNAGWDIVSFPDVVETVYTTTLASDRGLRDNLAPVFLEHKAELRGHEGFMGLVKSKLADGEFSVDVIDAWTGFGKKDSGSAEYCHGRFQCRHCNNKWTNCPSCRGSL